MNSSIGESQSCRFKRAAREAGADMTKEKFVGVFAGLAKPLAPAKEVEEHQAPDN